MDTVKPVENKKNIDKYIFKYGSSEKLVSCCFITKINFYNELNIEKIWG